MVFVTSLNPGGERGRHPSPAPPGRPATWARPTAPTSSMTGRRYARQRSAHGSAALRVWICGPAGWALVPGVGPSYGVPTGQAVAPLVVQVMRPWMVGLTGVLAV